MLTWIVENTLVVLVLAAFAALASRGLRARPALCHLVWLALLARLVAPPLAIGALPELGLPRFTQHGAGADGAVREGRATEPAALDEAPRESLASSALAPEAIDPSGAAARASGANANDSARIERDARAPIEAGAAKGTAAPPIDVRTFLLAIWLCGSALVALRQLRATLRFRALLRAGSPPSAALTAMVEAVARRLAVRAPHIRVVAGMGTPLVWSLGRPLLAWPSAGRGAGELEPSEPIVAHELAHLRRRDHWVAWLEVAALCLCWWNPVFWLVQRRLREHAELACDAWVVTLYPERRRAYAVSLIDAAERRSAQPLAAPALGATDTTVHTFRRRLEMILRDRVSCRVSPAAGALALLCTLLALPSRSTTSPRSFEEGELARGPIESQLEPVFATAALRARAQHAFDAMHWRDAADAYRELAERDAQDGEARHFLGYALLAARDPTGYAEAAKAFEEQARLGHRLETAEYNAACAYALAGDAEAGLEHLHRAVHAGFLEAEMLGKDADLDALRGDARFAEYAGEVDANVALRAAADEAFGAKKWKEAADAYAKLAEALPMDGWTRARLGDVYDELGDDARAAECYAAAAERGNDAPRTLFLAARAKSRAGDVAGALEGMWRAVDAGYSDYKVLNVDTALDPLRKDARFRELVESVWKLELAGRDGYAAEQKSDWSGAAESYRLVLKQRPKDGAVCAKLGRVLFREGAYAEAVDAYVRQAQNGYMVAAALYDVACAKAQLGETDSALAHAERAIELGFADAERMRRDPDLASVQDEPRFQSLVRLAADRAFLRNAKAADWDELLERSQDAIQMDPRNGKAHYELGWTYLRLGDYERAAHAFEAQDALGFSPGIARYNAGCAYALADDADQAFVWLERAAQIGFADAGLLESDADLASLRDDPRFDPLVERLRTAPPKEASARAADAAWKPAGANPK